MCKLFQLRSYHCNGVVIRFIKLAHCDEGVDAAWTVGVDHVGAVPPKDGTLVATYHDFIAVLFDV